MTVMKYNPGFLTHDELIESFCVRTHEFESIIEMLRECDSNSNPHRLVIGPRGCGKTNLLLRVAVEIVRDQELSLSLFPIVFSEESYGVANTDEFWLEALYRLAEQTTRLEGDDDLNLTYKELREIRDDRTLGKRCLSTLLDFSNRYGKRLILIVENLNLMFRDIMDAEAGWKLRHTLQTEPRIILLASATSRFDEIDRSDRAFYDLFVCQTLQPLGTVECAILWENVSGQHRLPEDMRGLRILTGGSPRLLSIIARFRADLSFRDLMTDLLKLIDDLTEYFKNHIEALPPQERRVYVALADLWEPATAREVAVQARLGTSKSSALLNRLIERGAVEVVGGSARRKLYYLAERLYNIYYLLRRSHTQKPLIEALIRFMDAYYSPPELRDVGIRMVREASELESETKTLHWTAFARLIDLPVLASDRKELLSKVPQELAEHFGLGRSHSASEIIKSTTLESATLQPDNNITVHDEEREEQTLDETLVKTESIAASQISNEDAATVIRSILHRMEANKAPSAQAEAARAIVDEGISFLHSHQPAETVVACEEVERQFSEITTPSVLIQVARALNNKGIALARLGRTDEELASYDKVVRQFSSSAESDLRLQVAIALLYKGKALAKLKRRNEELVTFDDIVRIFGDSELLSVREQVAFAMFLKGVTLNELDRLYDAITTCDQMVERFGDSNSPWIIEHVAKTLYLKGHMLESLDRPAEGLAAYDEIVRRFGGNGALGVRVQVAYALINKGIVLGKLNRLDEELVVYDEVVRRFGENEAPLLIEQVAKASLFKGITLDELDRTDEAITTFDEIERRFGGTSITAILEVISQALLYKATLLIQSNRYEEAIAACDDVTWRFGDDETHVFHVQIAKSLVLKSVALIGLDQVQKAKMVWEEVLRRFGSSEDADFLLPVSTVMLQLADIARKQGQLDETISTIGQLFDRITDQASHQRCEGLLIRAHAFVAIGDAQQAERDIEAALALLPDFDFLLGMALDVLMDFTVLQGPQQAKQIIQASPSVEQLIPLTIAIDKDLGNKPRVAREIEEVAEDIRKDLENRRKSNDVQSS